MVGYQDQTVNLDNLDRLTQRYVIMVLYYACGGENWRGYTTPFVEVETNEELRRRLWRRVW
jgi:hypothetical protein